MKTTGVDIKVNDKEGVDVKVPGVNVQVNEEEGVKGTGSFDVSEDDGADVESSDAER